MPPHRAQSSVRVNATLHHPLFTSCVFPSVHVWDHRAYGAVRRVHSFFPYNVTDARNALRLAPPPGGKGPIAPQNREKRSQRGRGEGVPLEHMVGGTRAGPYTRARPAA